ncbi:hypothetical protein INR49_031173, partial [Caranx melampygus]
MSEWRDPQRQDREECKLATVNLFLQLSKLACNVCSVAVQHRGITSTDLTRVVQDDHLGESRDSSGHMQKHKFMNMSMHISAAVMLSVRIPNLRGEAGCLLWWVTPAVPCHIATANILDRHVLDIEAYIVPRECFGQGLMTSCRGKRRGLSVGRVGGWMASSASSSVVPEALPSLRLIFQPLNQSVGKEGVFTSLPILRDASFKLTHACSHDQHSTVGLKVGYTAVLWGSRITMDTEDSRMTVKWNIAPLKLRHTGLRCVHRFTAMTQENCLTRCTDWHRRSQGAAVSGGVKR